MQREMEFREHNELPTITVLSQHRHKRKLKEKNSLTFRHRASSV